MRTLAIALALFTAPGCIFWSYHPRWQPHEIIAETQSPWPAGGTATISVRLTARQSDTPVRGHVEAWVGRQKVASADADDAGRATLVVRVPDADGEGGVWINSRTHAGSRSDWLAVPIRRAAPLFFALDRPLAQPGQAIQMRALVFKGDGTADAGGDVAFEVFDAQANRVFRQKVRASEFGVAHATFALADEVSLGDYRATATAGSTTVERAFSVKRYALPRFRVAFATDRAFVAPGDTLRGSLTAAYVFGKPVARAAVVLHVDTESREISRQAVVADETGRAEFAVDAPQGRLLRFTAEITDEAGHVEAAAHVVPIAAAPLLIHAVPSCGRIVPGLANDVLIFVTAPDGGLAEAEVTVDGRTETTNALGVATLSVAAERVTVTARDARGRRAEKSFTFATGGGLVVKPSRRAPRAGTPLDVDLVSARDGDYAVTLRSDRGVVTQARAVVAQGRGRCSFALPPDLDGRAAIEAGDASVLVWVRGPRRLDVRVKPEDEVVRPGETTAVRFSVRDAGGRPVRAALGVSILDEALLGLAEIDPEADLAAYALRGIATGHAARALWGETDDVRAEAAAALVLAGQSMGAGVVRLDSWRGR